MAQASNTNNRRKVFLAIVLALAASSMICVLGVAAAGYTISSPFVDHVISYFTNGNDEVASPNNGGGSPIVQASTPTDGSGGSSGSDGSSSDGSGDTGDNPSGEPAGSQNCFLGLLCVNAAADTSNSGVNAAAAGGADNGGNGVLDVNADAQAAGDNSENCFLGLVCLTANTQADTNDTVDALLNNNITADQQDLNIDTNADANDIGQNLGLNADVNPNGDAQGDGCVLGLVCLNTD